MPDAVISVSLPGVDPGHSAFQAAYAELLEDLGTAPSLRPRERDLPAGAPSCDGGFKGLLTELVVSLSAPGSIAALVKIVQIWLARDRRRSLKVTVHTTGTRATGTQTTYEISGDGVSVETLRHALEAAAQANPAADDPAASDSESA